MNDMYELMDRWGAWAADESNGVDWQPVAAGFKGLLPHGKKTRFQCNDDEGIKIDSSVSRLKNYKPKEYELVIAHFVIGISLRAIAKKGNVQMVRYEKNYRQLWVLLAVFCP